MQNTIRNEWVYNQSPKEVWEYLTKPDLVALWLMPTDIKPVLGHEFQFTNKPIPSLDLDGIFHCKILEIVPYQKLIYSWKGGPGNGVVTLDIIVEWTLEKHGKGTKLLLNNTGFKEGNLSIFKGMTDGWNSNIQKMIKHLNENPNDSANV